MNLVLSTAVAILGVWVWLLSSHGLPRAQLEALQLVHQQITAEHVQPPPSEELMWSAIEGMVGALDRHSEFVRPSQLAAFEENTTGSYAGIGIVMAARGMPLTVKFPFAGGPAERAELQVGDHILAVDGEPLEADDADELNRRARERLLGPVGTSVRLTVQRGDGEPFERVVERGLVHKPSVKWLRALAPGERIGYLYLTSFQKDAAEELFEALDRLDELVGGEMAALVLDLRFDSGGLLDEAIAIANHFLRNGTIVSMKRRGSEVVQTHEVDPSKSVRPDLPLVLLVNEHSASASEVVAGALQDHGRAVLVGTRTYGKGVVQSIFRWQDLDFRLKLTTAHYYTPNGRSIERVDRREEDGDARGGIAPDRRVAIGEKELAHLYGALSQAFEPPERYRDAVRELSAALRLAPPDPPGPGEDAQLAAALEEARALLEAAAPRSK